MSETFSIVLKKALLASSVEAKDFDEGVNLRLDADSAVRDLKREWLYDSASAYDRDLSECTGSHYFLFAKNLSVTNISLSELLALLRIHSRQVGGEDSRDINFFSDEEYTKYLTSLLLSLWPIEPVYTKEEYFGIVDRVVDSVDLHHGQIFRDTIVVDIYLTSALIHIPRSLKVNIPAIVSESGYISSSGYALYVRRGEKAEFVKLKRSLQDFLDHRSPESSSVFLTPYAHDYFDPYEARDSITSVRNGLDGVRLELRKQSLSGLPMREALNLLARDFNPRLTVAAGIRSYKEERASSACAADTTVWLVADHRPVQTVEHTFVRSQAPYLIVYAQHSFNANQFLIFKERKPGWYAPITLPHTLSIGMVNIVRGQMSSDRSESAIIADPFCGSGTGIFDLCLRMKGLTAIGVDLNPMSPQIIRDNAEFFGLSEQEVEDIKLTLGGILRQVGTLQNGTPDRDFQAVSQLLNDAAKFTWVGLKVPSGSKVKVFALALKAAIHEVLSAPDSETLEQKISKVISDGFSKEAVDFLTGSRSMLWFRLSFYISWRAIATRRYTLRNEWSDLYLILQRELKTTTDEVSSYHEDVRPLQTASEASFGSFTGLYSEAWAVERQAIKSFRITQMGALGQPDAPGPGVAGLSAALERPSPGVFLATGDSVHALSQMTGALDAIITDPPYGFNTTEDKFEMQELHANFLKAAVSALRSGGQLMMAVPAFARTGQQIPFMMTRGALTRQLIAVAEKMGRRVVKVVRTVPAEKDLFEAPFYWQSASALSRSILWFTIH